MIILFIRIELVLSLRLVRESCPASAVPLTHVSFGIRSSDNVCDCLHPINKTSGMLRQLCHSANLVVIMMINGHDIMLDMGNRHWMNCSRMVNICCFKRRPNFGNVLHVPE